MRKKVGIIKHFPFSKNFVDIRKQQFIKTKLFLNLSTKYKIEIIIELIILTYYEHENRTFHKCTLIVSHVLRCRGKFGIRLDDFINRLKEILFRGNLAPCTNREHASFGTNRSNFSTCAIGTKTSEQFESNIPLNTHRACMDLEDVRASLKIR